MYAFIAMTEGIPISYKQAMESCEKAKWIEAMDLEMLKFKKEDVFQLDFLPKDKLKVNVVKNRWVFKKKINSNNEVVEYKARLVAKGFSQKFGIDFIETFAPVAKLKSIRALTALATKLKLDMYQDDVPSAFLKADFTSGIEGVDNEGWMEQPEGYDDETGRKCRLIKCIYGLKQSPREFNALMNKFLICEGFSASEADPCIYFKSVNNQYLAVAIYVDDIITAGNGSYLTAFRSKLHAEFNMSGGGELNWYLGINFTKKPNGNRCLDQNQYIQQKLDIFSSFIGPSKLNRSSPLPKNTQDLLEQAIPSTEIEPNFPYRQMVGSLMYAMVGTRFDICYAVSIVSQFLHEPKKIHCDMVRHIYQYLRANPKLTLTYAANTAPTLEGFVDAGYSNNSDYA